MVNSEGRENNQCVGHVRREILEDDLGIIDRQKSRPTISMNSRLKYLRILGVQNAVRISSPSLEISWLYLSNVVVLVRAPLCNSSLANSS